MALALKVYRAEISEANGESREASQDIVVGDILRININGKWAKCDTSSYTNATAVAICVEDALTGESALGVYIGKIGITSSYTGSIALFLDSDGTITDTSTTVAGEYITRIGKGLYQDTIYIQCEEPVEVT